MRLFIALEIPNPIKHQLFNLQHTLSNISWTPIEKFHITLTFIGESNQYRDICELLDDISLPAVPVEFTEFGFFGTGDRPRIFYLGVKPSEEILDLESEIREKLTEGGVKFDKRKFIPHVTLGRFKGEYYLDNQKFIQINRESMATSFLAKEFTLFSSKQIQNGPTYQKEASFQLF